MTKRIIFICVLACFLGSITYFSYTRYQIFKKAEEKRVLFEKRKAAWDNLKIAVKNRIEAFGNHSSVVIKDLDLGWEIDYNKDKLVPSASLVKIPIMLSCFYAAEEKKIGLKDTIYLKASEKVEGSKALGEKPAGSVFTVEELIEPMITQSDNTATNLLIDYLGFDTLDAYFKKIGLKNTNLARKMLDFKERKEGVENYTTAEDMAFVLEELYRSNFMNKEVSKQCLLLLGQQKINDRIPRKLPKEGTFIAHKTGLERHVCHDVGIVYTPKGNFLICVLIKHGNKVAEPAKKLISNIALLTYNYFQSLN
ncbi:MAG: class A beta-lactamase-related serine hydrolase [Candidatus Omnitrophica bacterium]|nr:class A beta-lactamase-related serine hydrolase [Candidatus Omnitrophota bacterium]